MILPISGPCQKAVQAITKEETITGTFTPTCEEDGYYSPKQFYGVSGESWCVTRDGEEVEGTRTTRGQPPKDCSKGTAICV